MSQIIKNISRPLTVGAVATLASMVLVDGGPVLNVIPSSVAYGLAAAGASAIQEVGRDYVLTKVTSDPNTGVAAQIVAPALTGASMAGVMLAIDLIGGFAPNPAVLAKGFAIAAGSEVAGGYAQKAIVAPALRAAGVDSDLVVF